MEESPPKKEVMVEGGVLVLKKGYEYVNKLIVHVLLIDSRPILKSVTAGWRSGDGWTFPYRCLQ